MGAGRKNFQNGERHIRASVKVRVFVRSFPFLILHFHLSLRGLGSVFFFLFFGRGALKFYISAILGGVYFHVGMASRVLLSLESYQVHISRDQEIEIRYIMFYILLWLRSREVSYCLSSLQIFLIR